jgi:hypothetical protein
LSAHSERGRLIKRTSFYYPSFGGLPDFVFVDPGSFGVKYGTFEQAPGIWIDRYSLKQATFVRLQECAKNSVATSKFARPFPW